MLMLHAQQDGSFQKQSPAEYVPVEKIIYFQMGIRTVPLRLLQYGDQSEIILINLHDNESTSVEAAKLVLKEYGGLLIEVENDLKRNIRYQVGPYFYSVDPNRIFSREGISKSLEEFGRTSPKAIQLAEKLGKRIIELIPEKSKCIIALHNNTPENFSALSYVPGNYREKEAKKTFISKTEDPDDFYLTTDHDLYQALSSKGFNTILQDNVNCTEDGSLSVYYGKKNIRYVNLETEHGKKDQYIRMLRELIGILYKEKK